MFKVTVLGSAGMFATQERAASGYLLELGSRSLWLDAGAGTWRNLLAQIDYADLGGVMITHRHPDHTSDVFQACHARLYGQSERLPEIPLWAPQETLDALVAFAPSVDEAFELRAISPGGSMSWSGADFSFWAVAHPPSTAGVRVEFEGAVFAYSADTGPGDGLTELARAADLFICEATLQDSDQEWEGHLSASAAARVASRAGAKHLLLTHLPPGRDLGLSIAEAQREASGVAVELAQDGHTWEVGQ